MIAIRLLGGAKKAVGKPSVELDKKNSSVAEILEFLSGLSVEPRLLLPNNLIVAVNGVDSASLDGPSTVAKSGDIVTIVTVVHGGTDYTIDGNQLSIIGVRKVAADAAGLVSMLRAEYPELSLQAVNAGAVYGTDHLLGVLGMTIEAEKRKIMLAKRYETEILLRLGCTGRISDAIDRTGLRSDAAGCFIAISKNNIELHRFSERIREEFEVEDSVLDPNVQKKAALASALGLETKFDDIEFVKYLLERAAILVR